MSPSSSQGQRNCGQDAVNCIIDAYSNHGWVSFWAWVQTSFIPQTAVAIAATCAIHSCLNR